MADERQLTRRGQERRDKLLAFATARFAEKGFHPTSVSEIVDGVGVGKGVFYWYFESKDELLVEILRTSLRDLRTAQTSAVASAGDPLSRLEAGIRASLHWSADNADVVRLMTFAWSEEHFAQVLRRGRDIIVTETAKLIEQAIDLGQIMAGDPIIMAVTIRATIDAMSWESAIKGRDPDEVTETAVRMCLRGLHG